MPADTKPLRIVLLTGDVEAAPLTDVLHSHVPDLDIQHAETLAELRCFSQSGGHLRLISFVTGIIVPGDVLECFQGDAYNFHPGPPEYPGSGASNFAVYEEAKQFGSTAHIMTKSVDAGPIIQSVRFDIDPSLRFTDLELCAYRAAFDLFIDLSEVLAVSAEPLKPSGEQWSGIKRRKQDVIDMQTVTPQMDEAEITKRFRAFG